MDRAFKYEIDGYFGTVFAPCEDQARQCAKFDWARKVLGPDKGSSFYSASANKLSDDLVKLRSI